MIKLYNSLTRTKEEFKEITKGTVKMYSCGLTVNNYSHIGNAVAYLFMDTLVKMLKYNNYNVINAMNITDVGHLTSDDDEGNDKILEAAKREKTDPYKIAQHYTEYFFKMFKQLNIDTPKIVCKATDHIPQMIDFVKGLEDKGYTYTISDGIYFDVSKFKEYGKLSRKNLDDLKAGARVDINDEKRNPYDFALWKFVEPNHIMKWSSPFGPSGCPGWHIECSAMGHYYLGEKFDIHTGGIDHLPIHHENEIAQSEALLGHQTVNYWMHCEFLKVDGGKMGKSLGNAYTIDDLEKKGYNGLDFRYLCLNSNYRKPLNFTFESLDAAKQARANFYELLKEHKNGKNKIEKEKLNNIKQDFTDAISDDVNIAKAIGLIWIELKNNKPSLDLYNLVLDFDKVLSLDIEKNTQEVKQDIPAEITELANKRMLAKEQKNYALSDELRKAIEDKGYIIKDIKGGFEINKKA